MSISLSATDAELREAFFALKNRQAIAELLEISDYQLRYYLYIVSPQNRYKEFHIPKKLGGTRQIVAPIAGLKLIQRKLNQVLQAVYQPKSCVHGFVRDRNVLTNASLHVRKRYVLNIDIKDFFPSINFGRVRGMFAGYPYNLSPHVATVLAQICCHNNILPQGAPTSPIVANLICRKLDDNLLHLARQYNCVYSRYADDISFSTYRSAFPEGLAKYNESGQLEVGENLQNIITANGFQPNTDKLYLQTPARRQQVTGITVNKIPNVSRKYLNQIRAMLYAWEKHGLLAAEKEFREKYQNKGSFAPIRNYSFQYIVKGKIEFLGMVRGKDSTIYKKYYEHLCRLAPEFGRPSHATNISNQSVGISIFTEGHTDWQHLEVALASLQSKGLFNDLRLEIQKNSQHKGSADLKRMCSSLSNTEQPKRTIFIFDNDEEKISKEMKENGRDYKYWKNSVFSLVIPVPDHRQDTPDVCIELYYTDDELMTLDENDRRLYLSKEFSSISGKHLINRNINCFDRNKTSRPNKLSIIDDEVFNENDENIALSKANFALYVHSKREGFSTFDYSQFAKIFEVIRLIASHEL